MNFSSKFITVNYSSDLKLFVIFTLILFRRPNKIIFKSVSS